MIAGYLIIRNHSIILDGDVVFSGNGELEQFLGDAYDKLNVAYPKFYKMDYLSKAGFIGAELLLGKHSLQGYK